MTLAELWRLKSVCCLEKLEEFVKRGGLCNSTVVPSFCFSRLADPFFFLSEIGELLCMKSRYGPGGEFEPDWYVLRSSYQLSLLLIPLS